MRDRNYSRSAEFLFRLFGETTQAIELRACHNIHGEAPSRSVFTRDSKVMEVFCRREDRDNYAVYFGCCTRKTGVTSGNQQTVAECPALWADIDCVKQGIKGDNALAALEFLPYPPTIIVDSGGGFHCYWMLEQPLDVSLHEDGTEKPLRQQVSTALRKLALVTAGDTQCAELARVLRVDGTMNTKDATKELNGGEPVICEVISDNGRIYDFGELCTWLEDQRAVLEAKAAPAKPVKPDDPFVAYARQVGFNPSIDIDDELAAMVHGAGGDRSIHSTQLRVSASMIARGYEDDEIVDRILRATEGAAPKDARWNWAREEKAIRDMIRTGRDKGYEKKSTEKKIQEPQLVAKAVGNLAVVHDIAEEREKRRDLDNQQKDQISILGGAVLEQWKARYGPVMHANGTTYTYEDGVWSTWDERHDQMLRAMLQEACVGLKLSPKTSLLNAATVYFMNRPGLLERRVEFDRHRLIVADDGVLDPMTMEIGPHSPDHRAMFRIGASLSGARECPVFMDFLATAFVNSEDRDGIIRTLQEWFGAALIAHKIRPMMKGLLIYGPSYTGKTQISEILRALLGRDHTVAIAATELGDDFGMQPFLGARGWVADDAISQGAMLDADRYKKIVTGEEVTVKRKNRTSVTVRFGFPVLLTSNHLPRVKDQSDAVYNRSLLLKMANVRSQKEPEPPGYDSISGKIIAEELTGVLWWAISGWQRLAARGQFDPPECMIRAIEELQDRNNAIRAWAKECVVEDTGSKVATADLFASFAGWYHLENGEGKFPWSQNGFTRGIKELLPAIGSQTGPRTRNLTGLRLSEQGLDYWAVNAGRDSRDAPKGIAIDQYAVNQTYSAEHAERARGDHEKTDRSQRF